MNAGVGSQQINQPPPRDRVEFNLSELDRLPTLPAVASRLLAATTSDKSSARDVIGIIESDAALTAAVLKLGGRADLGVRAKVRTVAHVVKLLGFNAIRNLVLSIQLCEVFSRPEKNRLADETRKELWRHALAVACVAQTVGERVGGPALGGEAFVCGLLHDIGKIALDACLPKSYARVVQRVARQWACICDVEREIFGLDHTAAGKHLVARWKLPQAVIESVWLHHQSPDALPSSVGFTQLVRIVHLADNLVRREGIGYSGYQHLSDVDRLAAGLGLDAPGVTEVLDRLPAMMEPFSELVGLDDSDHRSDNTVSLMAANRQLGQLNAKLTEANRYLQTRSACLAALEQFTRRCCDRDGISDVCVASAQSVRTMAEADCAVAFFSEPSSCCIHIGCAAAREQDETASVIDPGELRDLLDAGVCSCDVPPRGLAEASTGFDVLWQRCVGTPPSDPLWILPVLTGPGPTAGVLVAAPQEAVGRLRSASQECDALSSAIRLGMTSARNRAGSERMNEELLDLNRRVQAAQKELVHARSLAMIAKMADGAAHELNNPLAVVSGRAQMALQACRDEETVRALKTIKDQAERAARIVSDLMRFAKPDPPSPVEQSLVGLLESLCQHWRSGSAPCSDAPTVAVVDPAATVYADTNHLHQMLEAVLANAMEATQPETARVHVNSPSRASDETVRIVVEDNGVGMARDVLEHAVDPFFSGRTAGRGQGLGLSHAYRLAEINGGRLWLQSAPGIGTTVTIELPAYAPRL